MEELIKYVKSVKAAHINDIERLYVNNEVKEILKKHNLTLMELLYRIKHNIPLDKKFLCEQCGKPIEFKHHKYFKFCCHKCALDYSHKSKERNIKISQSHKQKCAKRNADTLKKYNLTYAEYIYRIHNNIPLDEVVVCKACGKPLKFKYHRYDNFCSYECSNNYTPLVQQRTESIYTTKKKNNTHNVSEVENTIGDLLKQKFPDLKRQFKSKLYPFNCDFYIPSQDLYIEFNGFWTHGWYDNKLIGAFDSNNSQHLEILQEWKIKNTNFYRNAIHTWTVKDPLKVKTAKQNNLNFMVFWTVEEVKDWINSLNN